MIVKNTTAITIHPTAQSQWFLRVRSICCLDLKRFANCSDTNCDFFFRIDFRRVNLGLQTGEISVKRKKLDDFLADPTLE